MRLFGPLGPRKGLILLYHWIAQPQRDPQLLAVGPDRFEAHLAMLQRRTNIMRLSEMIDRIAAGKALPRRAVAITFDDGYMDNMRVAEPMLARAQIPATLFVATGYVETGRPYWWDAIDTAIWGRHCRRVSSCRFLPVRAIGRSATSRPGTIPGMFFPDRRLDRARPRMSTSCSP
jgi:peptidoglycan/xylan/chitin deacetylase (PgdA/CDA1 family)